MHLRSITSTLWEIRETFFFWESHFQNIKHIDLYFSLFLYFQTSPPILLRKEPHGSGPLEREFILQGGYGREERGRQGNPGDGMPACGRFSVQYATRSGNASHGRRQWATFMKTLDATSKSYTFKAAVTCSVLPGRGVSQRFPRQPLQFLMKHHHYSKPAAAFPITPPHH